MIKYLLSLVLYMNRGFYFVYKNFELYFLFIVNAIFAIIFSKMKNTVKI